MILIVTFISTYFGYQFYFDLLRKFFHLEEIWPSETPVLSLQFLSLYINMSLTGAIFYMVKTLPIFLADTYIGLVF